MKKADASQSAAIIAAHRAIESKKPLGQRICFDPVAEKLIPPNTSVIGETDMPKETALLLFKQFVPGFHEYFIARTRYIDDYLAAFIKGGLQQLVILGAGYDSRAYRFDALKKIPVFEVDHPATQSVKKERLQRLFNPLPGHVRFVPVDLHTDDLGKGLFEKGYDKDLTCLFILEGVTMYLRREAVDQILAFIHDSSGPGSGVIFDFTSVEVVQGKALRPEAIAWRQKAMDLGEPLLFGIDFNALKGFLEKRGFSKIGMVTHADFKTAYFNHVEENATTILAIAHGGR